MTSEVKQKLKDILLNFVEKAVAEGSKENLPCGCFEKRIPISIAFPL